MQPGAQGGGGDGVTLATRSSGGRPRVGVGAVQGARGGGERENLVRHTAGGRHRSREGREEGPSEDREWFLSGISKDTGGVRTAAVPCTGHLGCTFSVALYLGGQREGRGVRHQPACNQFKRHLTFILTKSSLLETKPGLRP